MLKFFKFPFAITGTRAPIAATDPGTGEVNYPTGYPSPYQLPASDPASRNIERDKNNQLYFDITNELQLLQIQGVPDFITTALNGGVPYPYGIGATCMYLGKQYVSRVAANVDLPSVAASWALVRLAGIPRAVAGGTADAVTADYSPDLGGLVDGDQILIQHGAANTGAVTINPDGAGAIATYKGAGLPLIAGDIAGANFWALYVYDASATALQMLNPATGVTSSAVTQIFSQPNPTVAANAMTLPASNLTLQFRSATLSDGVVPAAITGAVAALVIPAGATLGTVNNVQSSIVEIVMNNAGTLERAVVNFAGGVNLDETGVISTTAIGGASNSANVVYSNASRSNLPYRVVRRIDSTQVTAGQWATAPSLVQGAGGNALDSMQSIGFGQTYQNVTGSRVLGTTYYNTTGKPILVHAIVSNGGGSTSFTNFTVNGFTMPTQSAPAGGYGTADFVVPPGQSYSVLNTGGFSSVQWSELR